MNEDHDEMGQDPKACDIVRFVLGGKTLYAHLRSDLVADPAPYLPEGATAIKVLSGDDLAEYDAALAVEALRSAKAGKKAAINANTRRLRDRDGLTHADHRFAMDEAARVQWTGLVAAREFLAFPLTVPTLDDGLFVFAGPAELAAFAEKILRYETAADSPVTTGRLLRQRVDAASTPAEVDAVRDDRP